MRLQDTECTLSYSAETNKPEGCKPLLRWLCPKNIPALEFYSGQYWPRELVPEREREEIILPRGVRWGWEAVVVREIRRQFLGKDLQSRLQHGSGFLQESRVHLSLSVPLSPLPSSGVPAPRYSTRIEMTMEWQLPPDFVAPSATSAQVHALPILDVIIE